MTFLNFCWFEDVFSLFLVVAITKCSSIDSPSDYCFSDFVTPRFTKYYKKSSYPPFFLFHYNKAHKVHSLYIPVMHFYTLDVIYETCIDVCQNTNLFSQEFNLCWHFVIFLFLLFITILLPFLIMKYASSAWSCTFIIIYIFSPLDFLALVYFLGLFIYLDLINKHFKVPFTF